MNNINNNEMVAMVAMETKTAGSLTSVVIPDSVTEIGHLALIVKCQ